MSSPFPGMNPYLEHSAYWSSVHHWLITAIARKLNPKLAPKYVVVVEVRIYESTGEKSTLIGIPDQIITQGAKNGLKSSDANVAVAIPQPLTIEIPIPEIIKQGYLEVRNVGTGQVITAIEILSPINKKRGEGRVKYSAKRQKILGSLTNLVEIDLLRQGQSMIDLDSSINSNYRILVSPSYQRPQAYLYLFNLPDVIPSFVLPLRQEDPEVILDLQSILHEIYDEARYDLIVDYQQPLIPALSSKDAVWVEQILMSQNS